MDTTRYNPSSTARRFEMGTPPVPGCYAAEAGLRILDEIGMPEIEKRIAELTAAIIAEAQQAGYSLAMPADPAGHAALITLRCRGDHELVARLAEQDIVTSCWFGNLRISPHFYNDGSDVDTLYRALRKHEHLLMRQGK
jgi:selenocysteine lyase/cysteine desulfurase